MLATKGFKMIILNGELNLQLKKDKCMGETITLDDNTSEPNENTFDDLPDENDDLSNEEDGAKAKDEAAAKAKKSSEIAQKIKYREKLQKAQDRNAELEEENKSLKTSGDKPTSPDKEVAAQKYIKKQALDAIKEYNKAQGDEKQKAVDKFQDQLDIAVEDSNFKDSELVDICEEYEVEPAVAVKILEKINEPKKKKPTMPSPGRGTAEVVSAEEASEAPKKKLSIWEIAQDVKKGLKSKT